MPRLTNAEGTPINAVLGFCNILNKILVPAVVQSSTRPYVVVVFDGDQPLQRQTVSNLPLQQAMRNEGL